MKKKEVWWYVGRNKDSQSTTAKQTIHHEVWCYLPGKKYGFSNNRRKLLPFVIHLFLCINLISINLRLSVLFLLAKIDKRMDDESGWMNEWSQPRHYCETREVERVCNIILTSFQVAPWWWYDKINKQKIQEQRHNIKPHPLPTPQTWYWHFSTWVNIFRHSLKEML